MKEAGQDNTPPCSPYILHATPSLQESLLSRSDDPGVFRQNKAFRPNRREAKARTGASGDVELGQVSTVSAEARDPVEELISAPGGLPSTPRTAKDLWALLQKRTVELASLSFSEVGGTRDPRSSGEDDEGEDAPAALDNNSETVLGAVSESGGESDGRVSRAGWVTLKAVVRVLGIKDDAAELAHRNQRGGAFLTVQVNVNQEPGTSSIERNSTTLGLVPEEGSGRECEGLQHGPTKLDMDIPSSPNRVRTVSVEKMRRERYSRQAFLLFFFIQLYLIQLLLSVLAIALEVASYFLGRDAILNPPSRSGLSYIFVLDVFVTVLLFADVSSHALAERCWFFKSCWNIFDMVILCLSIISLSIYTAEVMSDDALGEDFAHAVKAFRDFVRVVRLPIFMSNLLNVWRLKRDDVVLL